VELAKVAAQQRLEDQRETQRAGGVGRLAGPQDRGRRDGPAIAKSSACASRSRCREVISRSPSVWK